MHAAVRALKKIEVTPITLSKHRGLEECQGCGLKKIEADIECRVCETPTRRKTVENIILKGIKGITKVMNELRQGLQRVIVDEVVAVRCGLTATVVRNPCPSTVIAQ